MSEKMTDIPSVHEAWSDVMQAALGLAKSERFGEGSTGPKFNYRGIDALMNLVGPILRHHRVSIIPTVVSAEYRDVMTANNKASREVTVLVNYTIIGPAGDTITGTAAGESLDNGDKGTAKACSVALRVFLLQALCLPTDEPDPDSEGFQRSGRLTPEEQAQRVADGLPTSISYDQVEGVKRWSAERVLLDIPVRDASGNAKPLLAMVDARLEEFVANDPALQQARQANVDKALGATGE